VSDVAPAQRGVLDTNTLAELSVGPLLAVTEAERAAELTHVQQAEADFEPIAFDAAAARVRTRGSGPAAGRTQPAARGYDALVAATAILTVVPIPHPTAQPQA